MNEELNLYIKAAAKEMSNFVNMLPNDDALRNCVESMIKKFRLSAEQQAAVSIMFSNIEFEYKETSEERYKEWAGFQTRVLAYILMNDWNAVNECLK